MDKGKKIAVSGAAGFIASCLVGELNALGYENLILIDDFSDNRKVNNLKGKKYAHKVHREQFFEWLKSHKNEIDYMFHLGARTDTTEMDYEVHKKWNLDYSKQVWDWCTREQIPLLYASSAATYGAGEHGYEDRHDIVSQLQPLNPYGVSKNEFDIWALEQKTTPPHWYGVKFFNVFGPNEYHKGRMASVIFHAYHQIKSQQTIRLFRSHHPDYKDGEQMRDFVYVKDAIHMCIWLMQQQPENGIYNIGSGKARTFNDLAKAIFHALELPVSIEYIDTPEDIRDKYQYFTEANMQKLRKAGYAQQVYSLEDGVADYVNNYLIPEVYK
jgi:ADP-L-glycero-D-manno-heptose 6-epimerase